MERAQTKPYSVYTKRFLLFVLLDLIWGLFKNLYLVLLLHLHNIYIVLFSRGFYPKRLKNEDNRSNQYQKKSNNMQ